MQNFLDPDKGANLSIKQSVDNISGKTSEPLDSNQNYRLKF